MRKLRPEEYLGTTQGPSRSLGPNYASPDRTIGQVDRDSLEPFLSFFNLTLFRWQPHGVEISWGSSIDGHGIEPDMEQQDCFQIEKGYVKAVYIVRLLI